MKKKIILLLVLNGTIVGGAQKRYISLFNELMRLGRFDYFLIINRSLYNACIDDGILHSTKNITILDLKFDFKVNHSSIIQNNDDLVNEDGHVNSPSWLRLFLGRIKGFLKLFITWMSFIIQFVKIQKSIDIVYSIWIGGIFVWPLKKLLGFKLIHSYNDSSLSSLSRKYIDCLNSEYWVLKYADTIDFLSEGIPKDLFIKKRIKVEDKRMSITPNSFINYKNYSPIEKDNSIVFLSRLVEIKNPMLLLKAVEILNKKDSRLINYKFYIIGEGRLSDPIKKYVIDNRLENVVLTGAVSEPWKFLNKSIIFISLQRDNNYPSQSLIEAMACENAIVASDVGETRRLVTEKEGVLVVLTAESIAKGIMELLVDDEERNLKGENARAKVLKEHTVENFVDYFISITN
jgi:glycosyltransferase involved in cell wall biosynthesis